MTRHLDTIVELQDTLTRLAAARARIAGIPDWMQELHAEHAAERASIEALEAAATEAGHQRREAEAAIADAQEKLQRYQQQINAVTTTREYGALLQEIDHVKAQIRTGEEQGLAALERQEEARRAAEEKRQAFRELDERYGREATRWEAEKPAVAAEIAALEAQAAALRERVPRPYLSLFERLLERMGGAALAPVRRLETPGRGAQVWHCGACNYRVRPQAVVEIHNRGSLVQCESCKRILYLEEEPA
jgi:predicted  nucleic acid-binding Zn-ribbon protein